MPGLPKVQMQRREQLRAEEAGKAKVENNNPTILPSMEQPPQVIPERVEISNEVLEAGNIPLDKQWEITAKKWEDKFRSLEGVVEGLQPKYREEKEKVGQLEKELQKLREAMPPSAPPGPDPLEDLSEEELATYKDSVAVVEKIARKIARGKIDEALKDVRNELKELRESTKNVQVDLRTSSEAQFMEHVKSSIKNFDKIIEEPEWQDYLKQKAPYSRSTFYEKLQKAHAARDLETITEIFSGFKPSRAALERMKVPSFNGGGGSPLNTNPQQKPILKMSERRKLSEDVRMGRISRNSDEFKKKDTAFREAEAENRIDYNS